MTPLGFERSGGDYGFGSSDLPPDLERILRDQSIIVPQDGAVFASMLTPETAAQIAEWANASTDTPSALSSEERERRPSRDLPDSGSAGCLPVTQEEGK